MIALFTGPLSLSDCYPAHGEAASERTEQTGGGPVQEAAEMLRSITGKNFWKGIFKNTAFQISAAVFLGFVGGAVATQMLFRLLL